jgi:NAD(P)-dependent dehydrogenase (short-subunit alcohol dehydrogenase family)
MADKVAVVTGAGSGIGRASALALQKVGYNVALAGRRMEQLEETAGMAHAGGGKMLAVATDVGDHASVVALFAKTKSEFGRLDVLFNNAGMGAPPVDLEDLPYDTWRQVVDVNLTGSFICAQEAIKIMKAQTPMGGRIINNGSISAYAPRPNSVAYTATKHAITGLTKSISLDCRKYDIACGQLDVGNADTDMGGRMKHGVPQANGDVMAEAVMDVSHVADAVVHMASLPLDANVLFMTVMATKMPFVGRG